MAQLTQIKDLQRRHKFKQRRKNFLAILTAAAIVCLFLYMNTSEDFQEFLQSTVLGSSSYQQGEGFPVEFVGKDVISLQPLSDGRLGVLNSSKLTVVNLGGGTDLEVSHQMPSPRAIFSGDRTLLYDFGGKTWKLYSSSRELNSQTLEYPIYGADMVENGVFAIASGSKQYLSTVIVYNWDQNMEFQWDSSDKIITNLELEDTGREIAFTAISAQEGELRTHLFIYRFDREEPVASFDFPGEITISLQYRYNGSLTLLTDRSLYIINGAGKLTGMVDFEGETVSAYADQMDRYTVVVLGDYSNTKICRVVLYNMKGEQSISFTMNYPVKQIKSTGSYLYIYNERGLYQFGDDGLVRMFLPVLNMIDFVPGDNSTVYYMTFDGLEKGSMERSSTY